MRHVGERCRESANCTVLSMGNRCERCEKELLRARTDPALLVVALANLTHDERAALAKRFREHPPHHPPVEAAAWVRSVLSALALLDQLE